MVTNIAVYRQIALEALAKAEEAERLHRSPRPDGHPGSIITMDPQRASFKQSLIAITFVGIYLDALFFIVGTKRLGRAAYLRIEKKNSYEDRLKRIAVVDQTLLDACTAFREVRNALVHEKAAENFDDEPVWHAQKEARRAIELMGQLDRVLPPSGSATGAPIVG